MGVTDGDGGGGGSGSGVNSLRNIQGIGHGVMLGL